MKWLKKIKRYVFNKIKNIRMIGLKNRNFTIIANNCTGGYVYQYFGMKYATPTAGLFFETSDFIKLCQNPQYYFSQELKFISTEKSKNKLLLKETDKWGKYPIGKIADVEIYFMHYKNEEDAKIKWNKRKERINYSNIVYMYCENERCSEQDISSFTSMEGKNILCFTWNKYACQKAVFCQEVADLEKHPWKPEILLSIMDWKRYLNELLL